VTIATRFQFASSPSSYRSILPPKAIVEKSACPASPCHPDAGRISSPQRVSPKRPCFDWTSEQALFPANAL